MPPTGLAAGEGTPAKIGVPRLRVRVVPFPLALLTETGALPGTVAAIVGPLPVSDKMRKEVLLTV
jgi:hypothetical protein